MVKGRIAKKRYIGYLRENTSWCFSEVFPPCSLTLHFFGTIEIVPRLLLMTDPDPGVICPLQNPDLSNHCCNTFYSNNKTIVKVKKSIHKVSKDSSH